jgi:hypothetical protein
MAYLWAVVVEAYSALELACCFVLVVLGMNCVCEPVAGVCSCVCSCVAACARVSVACAYVGRGQVCFVCTVRVTPCGTL